MRTASEVLADGRHAEHHSLRIEKLALVSNKDDEGAMKVAAVHSYSVSRSALFLTHRLPSPATPGLRNRAEEVEQREQNPPEEWRRRNEK